MALTGRVGLLALLGAFVVGLVLPGWHGIAVVEGLLLAGVLADVALAGSVRHLRFRRSGEVVVRLGESAEVTLTVENPGSRRVRGVLRDAWQPSAGNQQPRHPVDVPAGERRSLRALLHPTRRGDLSARRVTVRSVGPLGLAARQGSHTVPGVVRALPPFTARKHLPAKLAQLRDLDGRTALRVRGQGTEFDALRDYVVGDDVRSIDWRATARRSSVVVRTWRPERDRHILLVLDTGRTSAGRVGPVNPAPRLDAAMDAALLLAALASRAGDRVDLLAYDRRVRTGVQGMSQSGLLPAIVNAMATLEPDLVELDGAGLAATVLQRARRRSLVVLLTALDPAPLEEGLLPMLPQLTKRHQVLLASVADPRIEAMARGRGDAEAVYGAAAAERARGERRRITATLTRSGVEVVDAAPADLPPLLADRYLALKAAGRL
ncbi:MAG: DUF58 domain-containing protein [Carbonactinosporaceae bacterium]